MTDDLGSNMGSYSHADETTLRPGPPAPADSNQSVEARGTQHGSGMANSIQPETTAPIFFAPNAAILDRGRATHEGFPGLTGQGSGHAGELGVLGEPPAAGHESLHPQIAARFAYPELRPREFIRLLNATALGNVIDDRCWRRHRRCAGSRFCQARRVNLLGFLAWLVERRHNIAAATEGVQVQGILRLVKQQQYRCALTGRELTPETAALDHIVPVSRGGEQRIENAQVLHKEVNRAKGTLTNEEFIALCREVVAHVSQSGSIQTEQGDVA